VTRALTLAAVLVAALAACGKYGPPVRRTESAPAAAPVTPPPVSAAPASSSAEQCDDPNTPQVEAKP